MVNSQRGGTMNAYVLQSLVNDHIRETQQQAAAAHQVRAAHGTAHRAGIRARWAGRRPVRGA
jgi:hypothetical protein